MEQPPGSAATERIYTGERYFANPEYEQGELCGYKDYLADREEIEGKFARVLAHVERWTGPGRLLDVGAGPGFLVKVAGDRGWQAQGLDLNPWAVRYAQEDLGVKVEAGTLVQAGFGDAQFDALTMMDLIEHFAEPERELAEAARVTRPGGLLAVLTPDAGSPVTRAVGARWPEVQRAPEHMVLFSVLGLAAALRRNGFEPLGWHSIGKTSSVSTLIADLSPAAPRAGRLAGRLVTGRALGNRRIELDPRAKFCLYARRVEGGGAVAGDSRRPAIPPRLPKRPVEVETAILEELRSLARARRLCDWMFEQYSDAVRGSVAEVGAGIGTFSQRILAAGAERALLLEPEASCAQTLEQRFAGDPRVRIAKEELPDSHSLRDGGFDLVVCQNVLEHVADDAASVAAMGAALAPGGQLALLVPAHPGLFGPLDQAYGHFRRYTRARVVALIGGAGLEMVDLYSFNLLGVPGWWLKNRRPSARIGPASLAAYEALVGLWRPLERWRRPPWGLSLVARARRTSTGR
jgi:2-polyprenyl-3-methyl-5-hydroxy-6-metoxy-1,4-benzoquinol methylase